MEEKKPKELLSYSNSYYLKEFKQFDRTSRCDFNWSAATFGPFWALYRKMYLYTIPILISVLINTIFLFDFLVVIYKFVQQMTGQITAYKMAKEFNCFLYIGGTFLIYQAITTFLYGKYGNKLYYKHVKKKIFQGYHLAEGFSATISPFVIALILISIPILSVYVISAFLKLLKFVGIHYDPNWKTVCIAVVVTLLLILTIYSKFDTLIVKNFNKNNKITNAKISEKNIQEYLLKNNSNKYFKILNIGLILPILTSAGIVYFRLVCRYS